MNRGTSFSRRPLGDGRGIVRPLRRVRAASAARDRVGGATCSRSSAVGPALFKPTGKRLAIVRRPEAYGLAAENVSFHPADRAITCKAWWIRGGAPRAALVFVHGGGDDNRSLPYGNGLALARDLVAHHYALLMIDLRNYGESDGTPEGITYGELETNDVIAAVDAIGARAPELPVGAIGFSMGGATALRAAAREPRLHAVVADSAPANMRDVSVAFTHRRDRAAVAARRSLRMERRASAQCAARAWCYGRRARRKDDAAGLADQRHSRSDRADRAPAAPRRGDSRRADVADELRRGEPVRHAHQAYRLGPEAYVARVTAFLDGALR